MTNVENTTAKAVKPVKAKAAPEITWHAAYDQRIAKLDLGTVPTADAYRVALLLGAPGRPKRPGVEALFVAMTLRPAGCTIQQFMQAGQCRTANNWLAYLSDNLPRAMYGLVHVTKGPQGYRVSRLTNKGVAHCKAAGMSVTALERFTKPVTEGKAPKPATVAKGKPKATASARKPAPAKPASEAPKAAATVPAAKPATVMTNDGVKVIPAAPVNEPVKA